MKKILLLHGWNFTNYSSTQCTNAWGNRMSFISELQKHFIVVKPNLPGFCGTPDPDVPWTIDNYAEYVQEIITRENPDYILGYSFGGALALHWKYLSKDTAVKTFLVSPAIIRQYAHAAPSRAQRFLKNLFPKKVIDYLRYFYLAIIKKNPYYTTATPVMRDTYRSIVTVDLRSELTALGESVALIYGSNDTATPPGLVQALLDEDKGAARHSISIINGGGHDIANSHTSELVSIILKEGGVHEI